MRDETASTSTLGTCKLGHLLRCLFGGFVIERTTKVHAWVLPLFSDTVRDELASVESGLRSLTGKSVLNGIDSVQVCQMTMLDVLPSN